MRMLLSTRHMPADPLYSTAINLIPADFNDQIEVMDAWRKYHSVVRERPRRRRQHHEIRVRVPENLSNQAIGLVAGIWAR
jgi:hypothetical protein